MVKFFMKKHILVLLISIFFILSIASVSAFEKILTCGDGLPCNKNSDDCYDRRGILMYGKDSNYDDYNIKFNAPGDGEYKCRIKVRTFEWGGSYYTNDQEQTKVYINGVYFGKTKDTYLNDYNIKHEHDCRNVYTEMTKTLIIQSSNTIRLEAVSDSHYLDKIEILCNPICSSHSYKSCYNDDVYWYDSCGNKEEKVLDCGTSGWGSDAFCSNNDVYQTYTERGCSAGSCYAVSENVKKEECGEDSSVGQAYCYNNDVYKDYEERGCSSGSCYIDTQRKKKSECGESGFIGNAFCSNNDVYRKYETRGCDYGQCYVDKDNVKEEECGESGQVGEPYCYGGDVYIDYMSQGCNYGSCFSQTEKQKSQECGESVYAFDSDGSKNYFEKGTCTPGGESSCSSGVCVSETGNGGGTDYCRGETLFEYYTSFKSIFCQLKQVDCNSYDTADINTATNECSWADYTCGYGTCGKITDNVVDCDDFDNKYRDYFVTPESCVIGCQGQNCCSYNDLNVYAPIVDITHPDAQHNNFVVGHDVNLMASVTDLDSPLVSYSLKWGDGDEDTGNVVDNKVNKRHVYDTAGDYRITLEATDGQHTGSDFVDIKVWPYAFDIEELMSYNDPDFLIEDKVFYRSEALYLKFKVVLKDAGIPVAHNINSVYLYNKEHPSNIYDLSPFNGNANGVDVVNGEPANPNGKYYYYMPSLPLSDDILGWNIVFVFSHNGTDAGQAELDIQVLNNPIQLSQIPSVILDQTDGTYMYKDVNLNDYVYDIETPDNEITWSFDGMTNVFVNVLPNKIARFMALIGWDGVETLTATADDNDGSFDTTSFGVSTGHVVVTLISPQCGDVVYGSTDITWTATDVENHPLYITLEYSPDNGGSWYNIVSDIPNTGIYTWDLTGMPQGKDYLVKVIAKDNFGNYAYDITDCPFTIRDGPDKLLSVKIIADKTSGPVPLDVQFDGAVTGGNAPFIYKWDFDNDGITDSNEKSPAVRFKSKKQHLVRLTVVDFDGDTATDTIVIDTDETKLPRRKIHVNGITIVNDELKQGEDLVVYVAFQNDGSYKIDDARTTVMVPDLGLRKRIGHIDVSPDGSISKKFILEMPEDACPGVYDVMVVIYDDGLRRVKYRQIDILSDDDKSGKMCC